MANHSARIRGFYAVLDRDDLDLAERLLDARPCALQIRIKPGSAATVLAAARRVRALTRARGVLLVINDRVDLALAADADAVHLGQDDLPCEVARQIAPRLLIGISTHDERQVAEAVRAGADYLGFGPIFSTSTKIDPDPVQGIHALARAVVKAGQTPVVAIGGIAPTNVRDVFGANAAAACAIASVNRTDDVTAAGRAVGEPWKT